MNRKLSFFGIILLIVLSVYACNNNEQKFEVINGIKSHYFVKNENGKTIKIGNVLILNLRYTTMDDSIIFDSKDVSDFKMLLHHSPTTIPTIDDAIAGMHVGDSALFLVNAESFYVTTKKGTLPKEFRQDDWLKFYVKVKDVLTLDDYQKNRERKNHATAAMEESLLNRYLLHANIKEKPSADGLYYIETQKGTGEKPQSGDRVTVHYTGSFIDGKPFDSSLERGKPFTFKFGVGEVIPGWDEGIAKMTKGTKAQLIIPSNLAYGSEGKPPIIPPYSTLIFDIELLDIQK